jgi:septal ring factor EnvC (AmiA/AmiB activator)
MCPEPAEVDDIGRPPMWASFNSLPPPTDQKMGEVKRKREAELAALREAADRQREQQERDEAAQWERDRPKREQAERELVAAEAELAKIEPQRSQLIQKIQELSDVCRPIQERTP